MKVTGIYRYPVKSLQGEALETTSVGERGIPGDRAWAVRDEQRGGIRGAKRFAGLMQLGARFETEPDEVNRSPAAQIRFPDGKRLSTQDPAVNEALSRHLGSPVTLWPLLPADALDHYRRGAPDNPDMEAEMRRLFARTPDEPLPDLSAFPPELFEYESPPGTYFDAYPLLLLSGPALRALQHARPEAAFDVRRFRPNLLLDDEAASSGFPEDGWVGRHLRIGTAELKVEMRCPRCVMTTHPVAELPRDPGIMRALVREHGGDLGVYASVTRPGVIRPGDAVTLL